MQRDDFATSSRSQLHKASFTLVLLVALTSATPLVGQESEKPVHFGREILPILSGKCFVCHGPDTQDPDLLRLDSFEDATADLGGYRGVDPDQPEASAVLLRIHDTNDPMPPADAEAQLTEQERDLLSRWIRQGGKYERHWAFVPPTKISPPNSNATETSAVIDAFIATQLQSAGIDFAPEAERVTLARRAALVLTGLPPEPNQLNTFLSDTRQDAFEHYVDQLLASPRFGEHQARYWLDAVRYGDTHGLHLDNRRGIYPYRDWVVRAFNDNLRFDDFITWQIAGDLLPQPSLPQLVATGFVRMNPTTAEGGAIPDEFQAKNNFDRTETFGTVLLGMTLTCARCHTHKYDPITQEEYFRLLTFFNSTAEPPMDSNAYAFGPTVQAPQDQAGWNRWLDLETNTKQLLDHHQLDDAASAAVQTHAASTLPWSAQDWKLTENLPADQTLPTEQQWQASDKLPGRLDNALPGPDQAVWISAQITVAQDQTLFLVYRTTGQSAAHIDGQPLATPAFGAPGELAIQALPLSAGTHALQLQIRGADASGKLEARLINPWQFVAESGGWPQTDATYRLLAIADPTGPIAGDESTITRASEIAQGRLATQSDFTTSLIAQELPTPRETRILRRGEYDQPIGDPLTANTPAVLGNLPHDAPNNRLGLAQWLVSDEQPLVTRVLVNRFWQQVFGDGIVRTPEDFGLQGERPTHPELLDWLAVELREGGWNSKAMLRAMVTSRTFRQDSRLRSDLDDPDNRLFARGPRYRLDAEVLRDMGLWASNLLDPHMGGEGVKPYQPEGMWSALAHPASNTKDYVQDQGQRLYRRSLYVYWKRTSPHPMMTLFDAPDRESACVRRARSATALQSLAMLNETQRVEIARSFAQRLLLEGSSDHERIERMFSLIACRSPQERERHAIETLLAAMRERYQASQDDALAYLAIGQAPRDASLEPVELAAWSQVTAIILTSDLALMLY